MSETGNGRKNWTRVVAAVGLVFLAVAIALLIGLLFGIVQGFLVSYLEIQPFIVTLAGMFFARGMTAVICKEQVSIVSDKIFTTLSSFKISLPFGGYLNKKGIMQFPYLRVTVVVALIVILAIYLMLKYTRFGRSIYAVGGNQQSATLMGLDVKKTQMKAYILSSFHFHSRFLPRALAVRKPAENCLLLHKLLHRVHKMFLVFHAGIGG